MLFYAGMPSGFCCWSFFNACKSSEWAVGYLTRTSSGQDSGLTLIFFLWSSDFPLYLGKNVVGRSPDCSVALPFPSISKQHAVIEISAWNKAPILQDCGSLNGTQIVKPPRVLPPGVSHRLRDQELILFADFPCQYHRLDVPPPLVPRSLLTIEKTPRIRIESQNSRVLLAADSEEEGGKFVPLA